MGRVLQSLRDQLTNAEALLDTAATRALGVAIDAVEALPQDRSGEDERDVVRRQIDLRSRAASQLGAANPQAADALRREAEVLTLALAGADG